MLQTDNVAATLLDAAHRRADKPLYYFRDQVQTHGVAADNAHRCANLLREAGVAPGDRLALILPDTPAFACVFLGAMLLGATPMVAHAELPAETVAALLDATQARALVTAKNLPAYALMDQNSPMMRVVLCDELGPTGLSDFAPEYTPARRDPDELGFMLFTSGSTGLPKGVAHRSRTLLRAAEIVCKTLEITPDDRTYCVGKFSFIYGFSLAMSVPLLVGSAAVLHPERPTPAAMFQLLARYKPTIFFGSPGLYGQMLRGWPEGTRLDGVRYCYSTGDVLPLSVFKAWRETSGFTIVEGLGSTETGLPFLTTPFDAVRPGSSGKPIPEFGLRLVDEEGNLAGADSDGRVRGHLQVCGPTLFTSYDNDPEKTAQTILPDGFVRTGDIMEFRAGYYYHLGRSDDMVKIGGEQLAPQLVEDELLRHPLVAECAVVARRIGGLSRPWAVVVLQAKVLDSDQRALARVLRDYMRSRLPAAFCPADFEFVDALPKTMTGKIQRYRLRSDEE